MIHAKIYNCALCKSCTYILCCGAECFPMTYGRVACFNSPYLFPKNHVHTFQDTCLIVYTSLLFDPQKRKHAAIE